MNHVGLGEAGKTTGPLPPTVHIIKIFPTRIDIILSSLQKKKTYFNLYNTTTPIQLM